MKNYNEVANAIFKRRDEYIAKQKKEKEKRMVASTISAMICCCIALVISIGLWKSGVLSNTVPVVNSSGDSTDSSHTVSGEENDPNDSSNSTSSKDKNPDSTTSQNVPSSDGGSTTAPSNNNNHTSKSSTTTQDVHSSDSDPTSRPTNNNSDSSQDGHESNSRPSNDPPSAPPATETNYYIDSIDKINFYSAKKIIQDLSLFPMGMNYKRSSTPKIAFLNSYYADSNYAEYPIDRNKVFTTTMVTYFNIELHDENGFLAQKLGGTDMVEVVITKNDIDDMGQMITFKRGERYYSCLMNGGGYVPDSNKERYRFSSHKYVEGFNIVKNQEQENYEFTVYYEGSKVIGFECAPFESTPSKYNTDTITFVEDFCIVLFTKQQFTIDQLEVFFENENKEDLL